LELIINKGNVKFLEIRPLKELIINRGNVKFGLHYPYLISRWDISHILEATQKTVRLLPWYQFSASHKAMPIFLTLDN